MTSAEVAPPAHPSQAAHSAEEPLALKVLAACGENVYLCYQCLRCTAGCPTAGAMDFPPHQAIRLLVMGRDAEVYRCSATWLCSHCKTCFTRCPQGIDMARTFDAVKHLGQAAGYQPSVPTAALLSRLFLAGVRLYGRNHEFGMMLRFTFPARTVRRDARLALALARKRRLRLIPSRGNVRAARAILRAVAKKEQP